MLRTLQTLMLIWHKVVAENIEEFHKQMKAVDFPRALDAVWNIISRTNKVY